MTNFRPSHETARLVVLSHYAILDTPPEAAFDRITRLAARLFDVPIALVSFVDEHREWVKSSYAFNRSEVPRDVSFGTHIVSANALIVVPDVTQDPRFADNPLVRGEPNIRFYAGVPLKARDNFCLGSLCILDQAARRGLSDAETQTLQDLAAIVMDELELRLAAMQLPPEAGESNEADEAFRESQALLQAILDHTAAVIYVKEADGRYLLINKQYERLMHVTSAQVLGKTDYEIFPTDLADAYRVNDRQVLDAGSPLEFEELAPHDDGIHTYIEIKFPLYTTKGVPYAVGAIATDITARKRAEEYLRFVAEASVSLGASLDYDTTLQSTARLAVPLLGEVCTVFIVGPDGVIRPVAIGHVDPVKADHLRAHQLDSVLDPAGAHPVVEVIRTGQPVVTLGRLAGAPRSMVQDGEPLTSMSSLVPPSHVIMPLTVREQVLGAMVFGWSIPGYEPPTVTLQLAEELTRRAAQALDHTQLYRQAQQALHTRDEFLAIAAHELKTPLTVLRASAQVLQRRAAGTSSYMLNDWRGNESPLALASDPILAIMPPLVQQDTEKVLCLRDRMTDRSAVPHRVVSEAV